MEENMLTNQKIQKILNEIKEITGIDNVLCASDGGVIGGTMETERGHLIVGKR